MSKLKYHVACTGILLGLSIGEVCLADIQNGAFPQDLNIRRSTSTRTNGVANESQYVVYVSNPDNLQRVRNVAPDAFVSKLTSGERVVQIGRFTNPDLAQKRLEEMRNSGLDAQVQSTNFSSQISRNTPPSVTYIPIAPPTAKPDLSNSDVKITPLVMPASPNIRENSITENSKISEASRNRYFVIIPSTVNSVLEKVQSFIPAAKLASSQRGQYIEVQGYPDRSSAETLNATMRSKGLDSRVIYF